MGMQLLVTGASGTLGRALLPRLTAAGHDVRALSRTSRSSADEQVTWYVGDLETGAGLRAAVEGTQAVVHCASSQKSDPDCALRLLEALRQTGGDDVHVVYISIVGVDRIPFGYYERKLAVERLLDVSRQPHTTLRATQFHNLILSALQAQRRFPLIAVPKGFSFQPIDVAVVADHLARHVVADPAGRVDDLGGPEVLTVRELADAYRRATGRHRPVTPIPLPGPVGRAFRAGANLCEQRDHEGRTFSEFLTQTLS